MKQTKAEIEEKLGMLFAWLRHVDEQLSSSRDLIKFLVARVDGIEIRMEGDKRHSRPHVHIKYKNDGHIASYAIDDGSRLAGDDLPLYYDPIIALWIKQNRKNLLKLWKSTQLGRRNEKILMKFQTTVYG
ncbi:MAG: DUF4160 domain-containing protein [Bradyrhizobium sp.]